MLRFTVFTVVSLFISGQAFSAGIPIIDAGRVQQMIQDEINKRINDARQEVLARLEQKTGIDILTNKRNNDANIAANTTARITEAVSQIYNRSADAKVAPFLDACSNVSIARTASATAGNSEIQKELPNRVAAYVRPDRNPRFLDEFFDFSNYNGSNYGSEKQRIINDLRDYEEQRRQILDDAILNLHQSPGGLTQVFELAVAERGTKERIDFVRQMLMGNGVSPSYLHGPISPANTDVRNHQMVEEGIFQVQRSVNLAASMFDNDQTAITQEEVLPIEAAIDASADPETQERLGVEMTNNPEMMVNRAMLQRWALSKAAKLAAMLQEYKRGQVELLQLAALTTEKAID